MTARSNPSTHVSGGEDALGLVAAAMARALPVASSSEHGDGVRDPTSQNASVSHNGEDEQTARCAYEAACAELSAEAEGLQAEIRAAAAQLEALGNGDDASLDALLGSKADVERALGAARDESWRLETLAELDAWRGALEGERDTPGGEGVTVANDGCLDATRVMRSFAETDVVLRNLRARLHLPEDDDVVPSQAAGDEDTAEGDDDDASLLDAHIASMEKLLRDARCARDEAATRQRALVAELRDVKTTT